MKRVHFALNTVYYQQGCYFFTLGHYSQAEQRFRYARRHIDLISGDIGHPTSLLMTDFLARSLIAQGISLILSETQKQRRSRLLAPKGKRMR